MDERKSPLQVKFLVLIMYVYNTYKECLEAFFFLSGHYESCIYVRSAYVCVELISK